MTRGELPTKALELRFDLFQKVQMLGIKMKMTPQELIQTLVMEKVRGLDAGLEEIKSLGLKRSKSESSRHQQLKVIASDYLREVYGFKSDEIHFEYQIPTGWVDVAGVSSEQKIAVEVGNVTMFRLLLLYRYFDEVIWIPYWLQITTGQETVDALVRYRVATALREQKIAASRMEIYQQNQTEQTAREHIQIARRVVAAVFAECRDGEFKARLAQIAKPIVQSQFNPEDFGRFTVYQQRRLLAHEDYNKRKIEEMNQPSKEYNTSGDESQGA